MTWCVTCVTAAQPAASVNPDEVQVCIASRKTCYGVGVIEASQILRDHELRVTAQRLAVMKAVAARPHATADEVANEVRSDIGTVSRQAVFDALGTLADKGLIRRIQPARSAARYEDRVDDNHHHLVCRICGDMVDVDCAAGYRPCLEVDHDQGFAIDEAEVIYWGICPSCQPDSVATADQTPTSTPPVATATTDQTPTSTPPVATTDHIDQTPTSTPPVATTDLQTSKTSVITDQAPTAMPLVTAVDQATNSNHPLPN